MIKELHQGNKILRENVQNVQALREKGDSENFHLQNENRDLRDRIEILESVIGAQSYDLNQDAWRDLLYPAGSTGPSENVNLGKNSQNNEAINQMAQELIEYRKGSSKKDNELQKMAIEKDELTLQNMQIQ